MPRGTPFLEGHLGMAIAIAVLRSIGAGCARSLQVQGQRVVAIPVISLLQFSFIITTVYFVAAENFCDPSVIEYWILSGS